MDDLLDYLLSIPLFRGVDPGDLGKALWADTTTIKSFAKGETIFDSETNTGFLGIIIEGEASVSNNSTSMRRMSNGSVFGVVSLFGGNGAGTRIISLSETEVVFISEDSVSSLVTSDPVAAINYIRFLTGRISFLNSVIDRYTGEDISRNLKAFLLNLYKVRGDRFSVPVAEIARRLNVGRRSVYRSMNSLTEEGAIKRDGKTITILDPEKLL